MENRRSYWRALADNKITCDIIGDNKKGEVKGALVLDISPSGLSFICDKDIPEGTQLKLKINFPLSYPDEESEVLVNVVNCSKFKDKFKVGCFYVRKK